MKKYDAITYRAMIPKCSGYLEGYAYTLEGIKAMIDASNVRSIKKGYTASQYRIIKKTSCKEFDRSGELLKRETIEEYIETYPLDLDTIPKPPQKIMSFWDDIPDDCEKAIKELKRLKVHKLCAYDCEETFADVWWTVLHEVDMYAEGEYCKEASRSYYGTGEPNAMNLAQARKADAWLIKWNPLFNKYKNTTTRRSVGDKYIMYDGQLGGGTSWKD